MKALNSSKFIEILKEFNDLDRKSFAKWLISPWCNSTRKLVRLLEILKKYEPNYDNPKLTRERLSKLLRPGKAFDPRWVDNLFWEANQQAEDFLSFQTFRNNQSIRQYFLAMGLEERRMKKRFLKISESAIEQLEEKEIKDWEDYLQLFKLQRQVYDSPIYKERMNAENPIISKMDENLQIVYLLEKATLILEKDSRNSVLKDSNFDIEKDLEVWKMGAKNIKLYAFDLYRKKLEPSEESILNQYYSVRDDFLQNYKKLNKKDQKTHLSVLLNDAMKLRKHRLIDLSETMQLYKLGLSEDILTDGKFLDRAHFVSIISVSNLLKDYEFTLGFIEKYVDYLLKEERADGRQYSLAHLANKQGDFKKSLEILLDREFDIHYFRIAGKILTMQSRFELFLEDTSQEDLLMSFSVSFEQWMRREKIRSKSNKESVIKFIQQCRVLVKLYTDIEFNESAAAHFLEGETNIQPLNWLLAKRDEIVRRRKK